MTHPLIRSQQWADRPLLRNDRVLLSWVNREVEKLRKPLLIAPERIARPRR